MRYGDIFSQFAPLFRNMTDSDLLSELTAPRRLLIAADIFCGKRIEVAFAPFDYVNAQAEVVIVGLAPGRQQMGNALIEARRALIAGCNDHEAMRRAKVFASFSGSMRRNLIAMLDDIGLHRILGIQSTESLWSFDTRRVHFTSVLRYPVFIDSANYSGSPSILSTPLLRAQLMTWFASEMAVLPKAVIVPLGPKVAAAVQAVADELSIDHDRILTGLPHPSGANAERIAYFLGRKRREDLSNKVDPQRLRAARVALEAKISFLGAL